MDKQIRCPYCNKLLFIAKGEYNIQIKCDKCKNIIEWGKSKEVKGENERNMERYKKI